MGVGRADFGAAPVLRKQHGRKRALERLRQFDDVQDWGMPSHRRSDPEDRFGVIRGKPHSEHKFSRSPSRNSQRPER
jgi:hypothetical protein